MHLKMLMNSSIEKDMSYKSNHGSKDRKNKESNI